MLTIENLRFAHPGQTIPYNFSLSVAPGEIAGIGGASGSGKSTLLDLVAGFLNPIAGHILLDGTELCGMPPEARPVSILFQADNLFDHLDVAHNLALGLPAGMERGAKNIAIDTALADVGLEGYRKRRAGNLSGGQKQRVALARTLLRNRPIVLLDEPFSALDAAAAAAMRALVRQLTTAHGWHTIVVSHDPADIDGLADAAFDVSDYRLVARPKAR